MKCIALSSTYTYGKLLNMERRFTILRRVGGSLTVSVPAALVRAYGLNVGDSIAWDFGEGETRVQFCKVVMEPVERVSEQVE
jgi:antitoxin component of MazEF toxin-antitoxin module